MATRTQSFAYDGQADGAAEKQALACRLRKALEAAWARADAETGPHASAEAWVRSVPPGHLRAWAQDSLDYLEARDLAPRLPATSDRAPPPAPTGEPVDPRLAATAAALDAVVSALPLILLGHVGAEEVLPPGMTLADLTDASDPDAPERAAEAMFALVGEYLDERRRAGATDGARVLMIGAEGDRARHYRETFLASCGRAVADYRFLPDLPQGAPPHGPFDVVIVSHVLHRDTDAPAALQRLKAAMPPNALLVVQESVGFDLTAHIVFGTTRTNGARPDPALRIPASLAPAPHRLLAMLAAEGFQEGFVLDQQASGPRRLLVVAESDGATVACVTPALSPQTAFPAPVGSDALLARITAVVRDSLTGVLKLDGEDVADDANFDSFGVDSLSAGRIINRIAAALSLKLPATLVFDHSSVEALSRHLFRTHGDALRRAEATGPIAVPPAPLTAPTLPPPRPASLQPSPERVRRVLLERPGTVADLAVVTDAPAPLGATGVRIAVRAFALNFGDILCVKGLYPTMPPYPFTPGMEVSGVVAECGAAVTGVRPGQAVIAMMGEAFGGHATSVVCEAHQLWPKPDALSHEEAASLPIAAITVLEVFRRAQPRRGESILIQTAAGGAGLIAVQLARHLGLTIFATAGTEAKLDYLAAQGVDHRINYLTEDFELEVRARTGGRGVDVVINTLSGDAIQKGLNCLAPGGRYVEIAMTGLKGARSVDLSVLHHNQSFHSLDLRKQVKDDPASMAALFAEAADHIARGIIRPVVGAVFPFDDLEGAYRLLEDRRNIGKVVVEVPTDAPAGRGHVAAETPAPAAGPATPQAARPAPEPIAVIGMSGRFPGCDNLDQLWRHLAAGTDLTTPVTRWSLEGMPGAAAGAWRGGFLDEIYGFDAAFFNIADGEALFMDPQQRVFLEEAWNALEDAGYVGEAVAGRSCGVFVGAASVDYQQRFNDDAPAQAFWGNVGSVIPARIAYYLDLQGPAVAVDTACSSSLVALHLACQSLWLGEVEMALAGGVFIQPGPSFFQSCIAAGMFSPTGRCHAFDNRADGFVPGEGAGAVVLKRLSAALADGDQIHGVIRGIGVNQDGTTSGLTAPSGDAQRRLQGAVFDRFGIDPSTISLVEAHGTGTRLGDPIEFRALAESFDSGTARAQACAIGSIKTNLGHTVTAAGITGVLKVLLALRHRQIPPSLHFEVGNAEIPFDDAPFRVPVRLSDWRVPDGQARRAAVSSFGFSGTNAHAVIDQPPTPTPTGPARPAYLVALSARTPAQLREQAERLCRWCAAEQTPSLGDLSFTLLLGRRHFEHRLAFAATSVADAEAVLRSWLAEVGSVRVRTGRTPARRDRGGDVLAALADRYEALAAQAAGASACEEVLSAVADLFVKGADAGLDRLFARGCHRRIGLPTYPFSRRRYEVGGKPAGSPAPSQPIATMMPRKDPAPAFRLFAPHWEPRPPAGASSRQRLDRHWILIDQCWSHLQPGLCALLPDADITFLPGAASGAGERLADALVAVADCLTMGLRAKPGACLLVQAIGPVTDGEPHWLGAMAAFFRSARLENPRVTGQAIGLAPSVADAIGTAEALAALLDEGESPADAEVLYDGRGTRLVTASRLVDAGEAARLAMPWKDGGVYLITGGGGALGRLFAAEIAARCRGARIVLASRSPPSPELRDLLERPTDTGTLIEYRQADLSDEASVLRLVAVIRDRHGRIDGVLHAAGVARDDFLLRKTEDQIRAVLRPKVRGVELLDAAIGTAPLDLFVVFSSAAAVDGNAGQSDYAAANAFLDRFARFRAAEVRAGRRRGRTLSINWPLWADGGMGTDEDLRAHLAAVGMQALPTPAGLAAFQAAFAREEPQLVVAAADLLAPAPTVVPATTGAAPAIDGGAAVAASPAALWNRLVDLIRGVTGLAAHRFEPEVSFKRLGIDSIMIVQLNDRLAPVFPELRKTLFFEFPTLLELRDYLLADFPGACAAWCGRGAAEEPGPVDPIAGSAPTTRVRAAAQEQDRAIAIIGLAGMYPQAGDLDAFWRNLAAGRDCITEVPADRWSVEREWCARIDEARALGKSYCKVGGFVDGFARFDPLFFGIAPTEALSMDPQERLFLQECWHAMEDAGYTRAALRDRHARRVGVFAGVSKTGYELYGPDMWRNGERVHLRTSFSSVANRVSHVLDLRGPSIAVDTMCSASLTAIHQACESLLRDECALAFAGGVNLYLHPQTYATLSAAGMLSPSGACRSFGAGADGFVPGEGVGVAVLKRLDRAVADGDQVHAVIRASAVNHGGHTHGYTVPNPRAQSELVRAALDRAGLSARDVSYLEAHGTGTSLGDPIEVNALAEAFGGDTDERQFCAIGSVKSNIGHLEAAAGIAGLTKIVLQMRHGMLAPSLHAGTPNGNIAFERTPFRVQHAMASWERAVGAETPRVAGLSSFGAGGANVHLIVSDHPDRRPRWTEGAGRQALIVLSAQNDDRLRALCARLAAWLGTDASGGPDLHDLAYTLQVGREAMPSRLALEVRTLGVLREALGAFARDGRTDGGFSADAAVSKDRLAARIGGRDPGALMSMLLDEGRHTELLDLWTLGLEVEWPRLYGDATPRRMTVPGYPFAEERYWPRAATADAVPPVATDDGIRVLHPLWEQLADGDGAVDAPGGEEPVLIRLGPASGDRVHAGRVLRLDPSSSIDAYAAALDGCGPVRGLVWQAPVDAPTAIDGDALLHALDGGVLSCFRLVKALLRLGYDTRPLELTVLTHSACAVLPDDVADPAQAAIHGFACAVAKEQLRWRVRVVDLDRPEEALPPRLPAPAVDPAGGSLAVRRGNLYRQTHVEGRPQGFGAPGFRREGVYVIIGGAGHLGRTLSRMLVRDHQARVVWIGRRAPDAVIEGELDRIALDGPRPVYLQADAGNREAMAAAYRAIVERYGRVDGVVHSAIVLDDAAVAGMSEERFAAVLAAKADICVRLAQTFAAERPNVLFFSSLESFGRLAGQSNYAAACLFADTFALRLRALWGVPVKVLNWGSWDVVDGKTVSARVAANMASKQVGLLTAADAGGAMAMLMPGPFDQLGYYRTVGDGSRQPVPEAPTVPGDAPTAVPGRAPAADRRSRIREILTASLRTALNLAAQPIRADDPLADYGVDSITGLQFIHAANNALGTELDVRVIYDHPTIAALTEHVSALATPCLEAVQAPPVSALPPAPSTLGATAPERPPAKLRTAATVEPIAVIGLSARYPHAASAHELWGRLLDGSDLVADGTRWDAGDASPRRHGGFLHGIEEFDPLFFGIARTEARYMDPQQRLFLQAAWHALEDAGYAGRAIRGHRCGVYAGHNGSDYHRLFGLEAPPQALWGNAASILSARIAYHLDLQGPALTVDTACSSSLVAIDLACRALRAGEVEMALAGGVQVYCTPEFHDAAAKAGMLSSHGRCRPFDARADGFVPAEGAGVLVLKRLGEAVADRDHIYGVILGSATNQDGATNGIIAPSGASQARLEREALAQAGVRARDIGMVEAHGTGTRLGDPIEFDALAAVFGEDTSATGFCALGSIKANIGHALAAAGVAGATKVLLSLQHGRIPPSVDFGSANPRIAMADSAFFVPRAPVAWPPGPRRAAVSSFGFSGTNAHMVFGEAPPVAPRPASRLHHLILLSAKGPEQLRLQATQLRDHCARGAPDCGDMSFTLAMGRHHFAHRLALVVDGAGQLDAALTQWLATGASPLCHVGSLSEKELQDRETATERPDALVRACRTEGREPDAYRETLLELARLHVEGHPLPFDRLFEGDGLGRVPLPVYPFKRERCWVEPAGASAAEPSPAPAADGKRSTPDAVCTVVTIDPDDPLVQGHVVAGIRLVPGATCLALARRTLADASAAYGRTVLTDVVWLRPIAFGDGPLSLAIDLAATAQGRSFALRLPTAGGATCCRGKAVAAEPGTPNSLNLDALRAEGGREMDGAAVERTVAAAGVALPSVPGAIASIRAIADGVLIRLDPKALPAGAAAEAGLHPAFLDAALQGWAAASLVAAPIAGGDLAQLLFGCRRVTLDPRTGPIGWIAVHRHTGASPGETRLDLQFCDAAGDIALEMTGLSLRRAPRPGGNAGSGASQEARPAAEDTGMRAVTVVPHWIDAFACEPDGAVADCATLVLAMSAEAAAEARRELPAARIATVTAAASLEALAVVLRDAGPVDRLLLWLEPPGPDARGTLPPFVFRTVQAVLRAGAENRAFQLVAITRAGAAVRPGEVAIPDMAGAQAVLGCLAKEQPHWRVTVADLPADGQASLGAALRLPADPDGDPVVWRDGRWLTRAFVERDLGDLGGPAFRRHGAYLLFGGAGALGEVLSEHLIRHYQAEVFWVGRRPLDAEIEGRIARLGALGPAPRYLQADARNPEAFRRLLDTVLVLHERIDGIVHSALVLSGSDLGRMREETFADAFEAKATICENMLALCPPGAVDLVLFFSSIQSLQRTERQANYAAGCAYKDACAPQLAERLGCVVKTVNWGYWASVGKAASLPSLQNWLKAAGMGSIEPEDGMRVLERICASAFDQVAYFKSRDLAGMRGLKIKEHPMDSFSSGGSVIEKVPVAGSRDLTAAILTEMADYPSAEFDAALARLLCARLQPLGLFDRPVVDPEAWRRDAGIIDLYRPWVAEALAVLADHGLLLRDGPHYRRPAGKLPDVSAAGRQWEECKLAWRRFPQLHAHIELVEHALDGLTAILTGTVLATEVLFPGSSLRLVEPIYKNNRTADYFNDVLGESLVAHLGARLAGQPDASFRLLEVGAGTGGTTAPVIERLRPFAARIGEYRFTDLSRAFLSHARERYGPRALYLRYATFDVEQPPERQDVGGGYDVAIAANVLHATRDIRRTLRHVAACLKPDGVLLLNEMSAKSIFSHLTFGLLKGWWLSEDPELRLPGSPVIAAETWRILLNEAGFGTVVFPAPETHHLGQQIIVAARGARQAPPPPSRPNATVRPDLEEAIHARRGVEERIRQLVTAQVARTLEIETAEIDPDASFADYGVDSLIAVTTVDTLNARLEIELTSTSLFEHSSVNLLTHHILTRPGLDADATVPGGLAPTALPAPPVSEAKAPGPVPPRLPEPPSPVPPSPAGARDAPAVPSPARSPDGRRARTAAPQPIAIVGVSGRFASADTLSELWDALAAGAECIEPITRWNMAECYDAADAADGYCWRGGFLKEIDRFDPTFFNISGIEATYMDPQQRLFLEEAWKALEDAGYAGSSTEGCRCGVYVGHNGEDYRGLCTGSVPPQAMWGNAGATLSARISYHLNLKGPAITVDTACSSSLVAIHLACQGLRLGEIDMALAGGVTARCTPEFYKAAMTTRMLSTSGHCSPFDEKADGFVPGEGVGAVLLKRLSDAVADGDDIKAVITGSCLNQDGTSNGITAPNAASQEELELELLDLTGVHPEQIQMVEAHGTGTRLGDPIEHHALTQAFRRYTARRGFCALGSIKGCVGHTTAAAGIASLVKVILSLRHGQIPPSTNFARANPLLKLEEGPFYVNATPRDWPAATDGQRRAAISSFGISGTNAHMLLEEAPPVTHTGAPAPAYLVVLSARGEDQLARMVERLAARCEEDPALDCGDVSFTLLTGRKHLPHRIAFVVRDTAELIATARQQLAFGTTPLAFRSSPGGRAQNQQPLLAQFGDRCLEECAEGVGEASYLERLRTVADLFVQGYKLNYAALFAGRRARRVSLPTYPFERERYWATDEARSSTNATPSRIGASGPVDPDVQYRRAIAVVTDFVVDELRLPADKVDPAEDIQVYGMDSLLSMRLSRTLETRFGVALTAGEMIELRSIDALARAVADQMAPAEPSAQPVPDGTSDEQERQAVAVLSRLERGEIDLAQTETLLKAIALS